MNCNGIDVDEARAYADLLHAEPEFAAVAVRTRHQWGAGYAVDWSAHEIAAAGEVVAREHRVRVDRPAVFGGGDDGPAPGELLLAALGACVTQQLVERAAFAGLALDGLEVSCEGELDLRGTIGTEIVPAALSRVRLAVAARGEVDDDALAGLLDEAVRTSPVAQSIANAVPLHPTSSAATAR